MKKKVKNPGGGGGSLVAQNAEIGANHGWAISSLLDAIPPQ